MVKKRCQDVIVDALAKEKVEYIFGMPGGHTAAILYDALNDYPGIKPILVKHEEAASDMACVWYQITGEPGVCSATAGPGVGHLTNGILEAYLGSFAVIAIGGCTAETNRGRGLLQEIPQYEVFKPVTKWTWRLHKPEDASWLMRRAFTIARSPPPGPVVLNIPIDVGLMEGDIPEYEKSITVRSRADFNSVVEAADLILNAEKPVLVVGGGARRSGAYNELKELAESLTIPVLRTLTGLGAVPDNHPLVIGGVGIFYTKPSKKVMEEADLVIGVGWHMEEATTFGWHNLPPKAKLIQIDSDPMMIGKTYVPKVALLGDAKLTLEDLNNVIKQKIKARARLKRLEELNKMKKDFEDEILSEVTSNASPIHPARMYHDINEVVPDDATYVFDVGMHYVWDASYPYFKVNSPYCAAPSDSASVGFGVAGALAGKLARPDKPCICIAGDAGVCMQGQEIATQYEYKAPVTTIFLNNYGIQEITYTMEEMFGRSISTHFKVPYDFVKFAESQSAKGYHVEKPNEIIPTIKDALKANEEGIPALISILDSGKIIPIGYSDFLKAL